MDKVQLRNDVFAAVEKLSVNKDEWLLLSIKTDEYGAPYYDLEQIAQILEYLQSEFAKIGNENDDIVHVMLIPDKISLVFLEDYQNTKKSLENMISLLEREKKGVPSIKSGKAPLKKKVLKFVWEDAEDR